MIYKNKPLSSHQNAHHLSDQPLPFSGDDTDRRKLRASKNAGNPARVSWNACCFISKNRAPTTKMGETMEITSYDIDFQEFSGPPGCLLESVDFDDLFVGIQFFDGDMLPEVEMDPSLLAELSTGDLEEDSATSPDYSNKACVSDGADNNQSKVSVSNVEMEKEEKVKSRRSITNSPAKDREKTKKSPSSQAKNNNNNNPDKRKTKVDWTPDLHRKFVKAVEQLGVDKAVPSRILELMGIRRLTRHNIASHLQKYRSHRKHLLEREAGAASWSLQKRQMRGAIGVVPPGGGGGGGGKVKVHAIPTMGFPPPVAPPPPHYHAFQHLHVWGHPTGHHLEHQPMMHGWPKHLAPSPSPLFHYPPSLRVASFWHSHHQHRFAPPPVQGFPPPHATMYKPEHGVATSTTAQSSPNHPPSDSHPTKESIDDAIGDVLLKPWLPLPIGLKPPSMDIVMEELQRQGHPSILPSDSS